MAVVLIGACAPNKGVPPLPAAAQVMPDDYALSSGDKVRVTVYGDTSLSGEFLVNGKGMIAMPIVGEVQAKGLTVGQLSSSVAARISSANYLVNPSVVTEVVSFSPYYVLGEVQRPGNYPTLQGTTILGAIASAGGFSYRAYTKQVTIRRAGETQEYTVDPNAALFVLPGDVIRVAERHF